jgi:hypothetical protein
LLPHCVTFWIGPRLGSLERACLRSVLRHGHRLTLYCYDPPKGVPDGVEIADASAIVPRSRLIRHRGGSPSLFSNLFRYELQRRGLGTWIDVDVYLLAPLDGSADHLVGYEAPGVINGAVLRLPPDSPLLRPLIALFEEREVPRWLPWRERVAARLRLAVRGRTGLADMPWGTAGPKALSWLGARLGLAHRALPSEVLYPVPWQEAGWISDPAASLAQKAGPRTVAVHLWNERIKHFKDGPALPGSFLARLQAEGA